MDCRLKDPAGTDLYNQAVTVLASAVRSASLNSADLKNYAGRGVTLTVDVTAVPGTDTVTFTLQGKDPASGKYYTILASAAVSTTGTFQLRVYPGLTAAANLTASDVLPLDWRVAVSHSAGTNFTYSVGAQLQA